MRKFFQVVHLGPRESHAGFFKHRLAAEDRAKTVRGYHASGEVVVYECRLGAFAHRREILRLIPTVVQRLDGTAPDEVDEHDCCAPSYAEIAAELRRSEAGRERWKSYALAMRASFVRLRANPEEAPRISSEEIARLP